MGLLREFKEFALRGNVIDLAVGVIIGGAFGTIVNSLIRDMLMPIVGIAGNVDFTNLYLPLSQTVRDAVAAAPAATPLTLEQARAVGPVLAYGSFITVAINFVILAFCIFAMIKLMNAARRRMEKEKAAAPPPPPPPPTREQELLGEIRDLLKAR